jgi:two-component system nitrate/nitrite response regulator NarL
LTNVPPCDEWSKLLSRSELKIALLVARGLSNKEVARELGVTEGTVKTHLYRIFRKLGVKRRYDLIGKISAVVQ